MPQKKLYREGDWFLVPLDRLPGQYGLGLLARVGRRGILGVFFGPILDHVPEKDEWHPKASLLRPTDAVLAAQFGGHGLQYEGWPVLGQTPTWKLEREGWRLPDFEYWDSDDSDFGFLRSYDSDDPSKFAGEIRCSIGEAKSHFETASRTTLPCRCA